MAVNRLPPEVLTLIIDRAADAGLYGSTQELLSCCLVCRRWWDIAQKTLYSEIYIGSSQDFILAHRTLMSSDKLAAYVRDMEISFCPSPELSRARGEQMVAECLERTSQLAILTFRGGSSQYFTKLVAARVHRLPKLKEFTFDCTFYGSLMDDNQDKHQTDGFDPDGWLPLPKSIQKLEFSLPYASILEVLPQLFTNLSQPSVGDGSQESGQCDKAGNLLTQPDGLRSLTFQLDIEPARLIPLQKFYAKLSFPLTSTLTSLKLENSPALENEDLHRLLSAMPLLENLELEFVNVSGDLFGGLKPFPKLQTFGCTLWMGWESRNDFVNSCDWFCQSFINSIRDSPHFHTFSLKPAQCSLDLDDVIGSLVHGLVIATSLDGSPHHSRLRKLDIYHMGYLPIEALEDLCQAAPNLRELHVNLNDEKPRILNALRNLVAPHVLQVNEATVRCTSEKEGIDLDELFFPSCDSPWWEDTPSEPWMI